VNFYFVRDWLKNESRVAQYSSTAVPKITVDNITRVDLNVWASEFAVQPIVLEKPLFGWPDSK
jgi:hypothetical protein